MKRIIDEQYHFERYPEDGNAMDDGMTRRGIEDLIGLLDLFDEARNGPEMRAIRAMTSGFTYAQLHTFTKIVTRRVTARTARHATRAKDGDPLSKAALETVAIAKSLWDQTSRDLHLLMQQAKVYQRTGLEENNADRRVAEGVKP